MHAAPRAGRAALMDCPFCAETVKDEALVCKHCGRDLRVVRPAVIRIQQLIYELDGLQRELDRVRARVALSDRPGRFLTVHAAAYVILPTLCLLAAHYLVTVTLNVSPLYLRIASVVIPLPFGMALSILNKIGFRGAIVIGAATALLSVFGMSAVIHLIDGVPVLPETMRDWRETLEYALSIALAYAAGNILALITFQILPSTMVSAGQPNAAAMQLARLLGQHVGEDALRRRARRIQDLMKTVGPAIGLLTTVGGSIYAGLKGILGN